MTGGGHEWAPSGTVRVQVSADGGGELAETWSVYRCPRCGLEGWKPPGAPAGEPPLGRASCDDRVVAQVMGS